MLTAYILATLGFAFAAVALLAAATRERGFAMATAFRLRRLPPSARAVATTSPPSAFYTARFDTLCIDAPSCQSYVREDGSRLFFSADGSLTVPVAVGRAERSEEYPAPDPAFAANPFVNATGLAYDSRQSTVTASGYGSYELPDGGTLFMVKSPVLTFGVSHSYPGRRTVYDPDSGEYSLKSPYPLDSRALWRSFRRGTSPLTGCSCVPEVDYGGGLVVRDGASPTRSGSVGGFPEGVATKFNGATIKSYSYAYDALSRPTTRNSDTFGYNERGEVVFSRRGFESAEDTYAYDGIGNLQIASFNFVTNTFSLLRQHANELSVSRIALILV